MQIDVLIEDPRWDAADVERLATDAAKATLAHLELAPAAFELSLLACDDARIAALNAGFRGRAAPTNVLSWPETDLAADQDGALPTRPETRPQGSGETFLGDIAIAYETCVREAEEQGLALADHVTHLIVHATLHLLGYDHLRDRDATLMEGLETEILGKLGVADPYRDG